MTQSTKTVEQWIEYCISKIETVEFLHGVPVSLPNQAKADLRGAIREALTTYQREQAEQYGVEEVVEEIDTLIYDNHGNYGLSDSEKKQICTAITQTATKAVENEWRRCIDVLDVDHSQCLIKDTCIGYGNAQSDLMNVPPYDGLEYYKQKHNLE